MHNSRIYLIAITLCAAALTYGGNSTLTLTMRHLKYYNSQSSGDNNGKVGAYERTAGVTYSDETMFYTSVSSLQGKVLTNATVKVTISSNYTSGSTQTTAHLYEQDKGAYSSSAHYTTYALTAWQTSLGFLSLTNNSTGTYNITSVDLKNLVQAWINGTKTNNGLIFGGYFWHESYYWTISNAQLYVEYQDNSAPVASNVTVSGAPKEYVELSGSYQYTDANGDPEGVSTFKWYKADNAGGSNATVISGATTNKFTLTAAYTGKYICFEVTPVAQTGASPGTAVKSPYVGPVVANAKPVASNVTVTGTAKIGMVLSATYTYTDADGDAENNSIYKWYRANDNGGTGAAEISGQNQETYTLTQDDVDKYVCFEVTPGAAFGNSPGLAVKSPYVGPVADIYVYPSNCGRDQNMKIDGEMLIGKKGVTITNPQGNQEEKYTILQDTLIEMHKTITTSHPDVDTTFGINLDTRRGLLVKQQGPQLYTTWVNSGFIDIKTGWGDWLMLRRTTGTGYWHIHNPEAQDRIVIGYTDDSNNEHWGYLSILNDGRIGVGTSTPATGVKMDVAGVVRATAFKVGDWLIKTPDYVFEKNYDLKPLKEIETFIATHKHLPEVPSEADMKEKGVDLAEMNMILLKKVEELTLYTIEQNKKIEMQNKRFEGQEKEIELLKKALNK